MIILSQQQGDASWLAARTGMITGSRIKDVMAVLKRKEGESAARRNYRMEIIVERLTGRSSQHYVSPAMEWGTDTEAQARTEYGIKIGQFIEQTGFVRHPQLEYSGSSPDGLIGEQSCLEIKAPNSDTHLDWLRAGGCPIEHYDQCQWHIACTERDDCHFVSFDPRLPEDLQLFAVLVPRDDERIAAITEEVKRFSGEIEDYLASIGKPNYWKRDTPAPPAEEEWPEGGLSFSQMADRLEEIMP